MRRPILIGVTVFLLHCWMGTPDAAEVISPKAFLELQVAHDLGDLFPDAGTQVLVDSGYVADNAAGNIATSLGQDMGEVVSNKLQAGGYGLLLWGGHGNAAGQTMLESCASFDDANARLNHLVEFLKFNQGDLVISPPGPPGAPYWSLGMVHAWVDDVPSACDVAFVNTSYGGLQGDFNATHRLADPDASNNAVLAAGFSCIMAWATGASYKTLQQAHDKCLATQAGTYPYQLYGNGDIQLFPFDNPAATVYGFSVVDGAAAGHDARVQPLSRRECDTSSAHCSNISQHRSSPPTPAEPICCSNHH